MAVDFYRSGNGTIQRVDGGYVLTITGANGRTVLLIRNDGGMIDVSGAPVDNGDISIAQGYLPSVGGGHLVKMLHQARVTPESAAAIRRRMLPGS